MLNDKLVKFCDDNFDDGKLILTKLSEYKKILLKENETMNLIGKSTIIDLDERHFLDCIQIVKYLPRHEKSVMDIGTLVDQMIFFLSRKKHHTLSQNIT